MLIDILRGLLGITVLLGICWFFSKKRSAIDWRLVGVGIGMQIVLAILILQVPILNSAFDGIAKGFQKVIAFTDAGSEFLFGYLVNGVALNEQQSLGSVIAFKVLPTIIFFSALTAMLYYLGILQKVIYGFAWLMKRTMRLTGAESLAMAANVFIDKQRHLWSSNLIWRR